METKLCSCCKQEKSLNEMVKNKSKNSGYESYCKLCMKEKSLSFRLKNPIQQMLSSTKSSAKKRNIFFDLKIEDIIIPEYCIYLNIPLKFSVGNGLQFDAPSIDRIDTNKGYVIDNINIISFKANAIKSDLTIQQLINYAETVLKIYK